MLKFPKHHQLYITHNEHNTNYEKVSQYLEHYDHIDITEEEKKKCIQLNEIWELQWYPMTPISFYCVAASTLEKCMELALEKEAQRGN